MNLPKHADLWVPGYLRSRVERLRTGTRPKRLWVAITDHYEPMGGRVSLTQGMARVAHWQRRWPEIAASAPRDSAGQPPKFTFFYPQEEYQQPVVAALEPMVRAGIADVDVHIHHDHDTNAGFRYKISEFLQRLHGDHGFLRHHNGRLVFGFIHGNWALDNSRPDGLWCGVQGELQALRDLGCYADFTMPSLPSATQGRVVNRIYWTAGDPSKPRGFDVGIDAVPGGGVSGNGILMVPGPLGLRFRERLVPRIEAGELAVYDAPTPYRVQRWIDLAPRLGEDIFVKLYGHTAREDNAGALLGTAPGTGSLETMFHDVHQVAAEQNLELHWATAYEMFCAIERIAAVPGVPLTAPAEAAVPA
ncbi:MAG: hypothetical protein ACRYGF_09740 [Janthinobacterium lividum]